MACFHRRGTSQSTSLVTAASAACVSLGAAYVFLDALDRVLLLDVVGDRHRIAVGAERVLVSTEGLEGGAEVEQ